MKPKPQHIVFFDGLCHFCNGWVNFIIKHNKNKQIYFAPLQSPIAAQQLKNIHINTQSPESVIYRTDNKIYYKSTAALKIFKTLGGRFKLLYYITYWIPPFIRNFIYDIIAKNRYKWFGKYDTCMIPDADVKERFL